MKRFIFCALCAALSGSRSTPALAQPPEPAAIDTTAQAATIAGEWKALQAQVGAQEIKDAPGAIARYTEFYEKRGYQTGIVSIEISSRIAQLYAQVLGNRDKALEIYAWAIKEFERQPGVERLRHEQQQLQNGRKLDVTTLQPKVSVLQSKVSAPSMDTPLQPTVAVLNPAMPPLTAKAVAPPFLPPTPRVTVPTIKAPAVVTPAVVTPAVNAASAVATSINAPVVTMPSVTMPAVTAPTVITPSAAPSAPVPEMLSPQIVAPKSAAPTVDATRATARATLIAQLQAALEPAGVVSEESVVRTWQRSGLVANDLIALLAAGFPKGDHMDAVRLSLAGLLAKHGEEQLRDTNKLTPPVRLALADYYASVGDEKAVSLYKGLLDAIKQGGPQPRWVFELESLSNFYKAKGDFVKAAATLAEVESYSTLPEMRGNKQVAAARLYRQAGNDAKATELYQKVLQDSGSWGWGVGLAIWDQANILMVKGKYEEARKLLQTPVTGQYAEQVKVMLLSLLGDSYYHTGEFEAAYRYSREAISQYKYLPNPLLGEGLEEAIEKAQQVLRSAEQRMKEPIICEPRELHLYADQRWNQPSTRWLFVSTHRAVPLIISTDATTVKAQVVIDEQKINNNEVDVVRKIAVEMLPEFFTQPVTATLTVSSPVFPGFQIRILICP